jgi:hypothetical protein
MENNERTHHISNISCCGKCSKPLFNKIHSFPTNSQEIFIIISLQIFLGSITQQRESNFAIATTTIYLIMTNKELLFFMNLGFAFLVSLTLKIIESESKCHHTQLKLVFGRPEDELLALIKLLMVKDTKDSFLNHF